MYFGGLCFKRLLFLKVCVITYSVSFSSMYLLILHPFCCFPFFLSSQSILPCPLIPSPIHSSSCSIQKRAGLTWITIKHGIQVSVRLSTLFCIMAEQCDQVRGIGSPKPVKESDSSCSHC